MLLGEYEYRIDQKGRVSIPSRLRKEFQDGLVLTRGLDRCIVVYPSSEWSQISGRLSSLPNNLEKNRRLNRFTFGSAFSAELDAQGRVALHPSLMEHAGIEGAVTIVGCNSYLEIWSKELWDEEKRRMVEEAPQLAERMETR